MSINKELYDAIESNTKIEDKVWFNNNMEFVKEIYIKYGVNYDYSNVIDIIKNINIDFTDGDTKYDKSSNTLQIGSSLDNAQYNICKSFIQIASQDGLTRIDENNNVEWVKLNDIFIDRIILDTTGLTKEESNNDDLYTLTEKDEKKAKEDELMYMLTKTVPTDKLVTYFAYGQGNKLYDEYFKENKDVQSL